MDVDGLLLAVRKRWRCVLLGALLGVFAIGGAWTVRSLVGTPSVKWMDVHHLSDLRTWSEYAAFMRHTRAPIPPVLVTLEAIDNNLFGRPILTTEWLYRVGIIAIYLLAMIAARSPVWRLALSFVCSVAFLWATRCLHPYNPIIYDIYLPLLLWLFLFGLSVAARAATERGGAWASFLAGLCASMAELLRPFMIAVLPLLLLAGFAHLRPQGRSRLLWFLLPILLFSGGWHAWVWTTRGQVILSNHGGFNMHRAWGMVPEPPLVPETHRRPIKPGRWRNRDTIEHQINSDRLRHAIAQYVVAHPGEALCNVGHRLRMFLYPRTKMRTHEALDRHPFLRVYRWVFRGATAFFVVNLIRLGWFGVRSPRRALGLFSNRENVMLLVMAAYIVLVGVFEEGEEARFVLSLCPFLAALPLARETGRPEPSA